MFSRLRHERNIHNIRGVILEEAVLYLLKSAGFDLIENVGSDPTLTNGAAGLFVLGRGSKHQIDAIADFRIVTPFSHPQRLLGEAKCLRGPVGIGVIRNAVGVHRDVSEYWTPRREGRPAHRRYHYLSAVFSATGFTKDAQEYAFAQDIYLLPMGRSRFLRPLLRALDSLEPSHIPNDLVPDRKSKTKFLRQYVRSALRGAAPQSNEIGGGLDVVVAECVKLRGAYLAMMGRQFPVFLVPSERLREGLDALSDVYVRIYRTQQGEFLIRDEGGKDLFSFDVPPVLFDLYASSGALSDSALVNMKAEAMREFQITESRGDIMSIRIIRLDEGWLETIRGSQSDPRN